MWEAKTNMEANMLPRAGEIWAVNGLEDVEVTVLYVGSTNVAYLLHEDVLLEKKESFASNCTNTGLSDPHFIPDGTDIIYIAGTLGEMRGVKLGFKPSYGLCYVMDTVTRREAYVADVRLPEVL